MLGPEAVVIHRVYVSMKRGLVRASYTALNAVNNHAEVFRAKKQATEKKKELKRRAEDEAMKRAENSRRVLRARQAVMPIAQFEQRLRPISERRQAQAVMACARRSAVDGMLALGQDA